jgi:acyl-CoA thioesterase FadM
MTASARCSVAVPCRVEWLDTDASGHYHHGTVIRWVESAEAELFRRIGCADIFGRIPRVHYEADYHSRVWFGDEVELRLTVDRVGRSSLSMSFTALSGDTVVASGKLIQVNAGEDDGRAAPWSEDVRRSLETMIPANGAPITRTTQVRNP